MGTTWLLLRFPLMELGMAPLSMEDEATSEEILSIIGRGGLVIAAVVMSTPVLSLMLLLVRIWNGFVYVILITVMKMWFRFRLRGF